MGLVTMSNVLSYLWRGAAHSLLSAMGFQNCQEVAFGKQAVQKPQLPAADRNVMMHQGSGIPDGIAPAGMGRSWREQLIK